jgi:plastocyanin
MKKSLLSVMLFAIAATVNSATFTVTNSGSTFTPSTITIAVGDNVDFSLASIHNAIEVSQATWTANGNSPLSGGFSVAFGGGSVSSAKLTIGTHYYVCEVHASMGMKGMIIVENSTGITEKHTEDKVAVYPNPSNGYFNLKIAASQSLKEYELVVCDVKGEVVYEVSGIQQNSISPIDVANLPKGAYFVKLFNKSEEFNRKIVIK